MLQMIKYPLYSFEWKESNLLADITKKYKIRADLGMPRFTDLKLPWSLLLSAPTFAAHWPGLNHYQIQVKQKIKSVLSAAETKVVGLLWWRLVGLDGVILK